MKGIALLLIGQVYPAVVQSFLVTPNAQTYEIPFIEREIAGTRAAYGLSNVSVSNFTGDKPLTLANVQNDQVTVNNLRLWDFAPLKDTYEQLQTIRTYYTFYDIDIDRYQINNQYTSMEISAREFDFSKLPPAAQNWVNQHLQYTLGYGMAGSPVNASSPAARSIAALYPDQDASSSVRSREARRPWYTKILASAYR